MCVINNKKKKPKKPTATAKFERAKVNVRISVHTILNVMLKMESVMYINVRSISHRCGDQTQGKQTFTQHCIFVHSPRQLFM